MKLSKRLVTALKAVCEKGRHPNIRLEGGHIVALDDHVLVSASMGLDELVAGDLDPAKLFASEAEVTSEGGAFSTTQLVKKQPVTLSHTPWESSFPRWSTVVPGALDGQRFPEENYLSISFKPSSLAKAIAAFDPEWGVTIYIPLDASSASVLKGQDPEGRPVTSILMPVSMA